MKRKNTVTYCYALIELIKENKKNRETCTAILKTKITQEKIDGKWIYVSSPFDTYIASDKQPLMFTVGNQLILTIEEHNNGPKAFYIYDSVEKKWLEKYKLSPEFPPKKLHYITGIENNWWIKSCNKNDPVNCKVQEIKALPRSLETQQTSYIDASIAPDGHNVWFIERNQDKNTQKQKYYLKIIDLHDQDKDEEVIQKSTLTSSDNINFSSLNNFVAINDKKAFFVDMSKKNIYSISPKANARLCETTQKPIDAVNVFNDTLVVAMGKELYKYVPSPKTFKQARKNAVINPEVKNPKPSSYKIAKPYHSTSDVIMEPAPEQVNAINQTPSEPRPAPSVPLKDVILVQPVTRTLEIATHKTEIPSVAPVIPNADIQTNPTNPMSTIEEQSSTKKERVQSKTSRHPNYLSKIIAQRNNQAGTTDPLRGYTDELQLEPKEKSLEEYYKPKQKAADSYYDRARAWIHNVTTNLWAKMW